MESACRKTLAQFGRTCYVLTEHEATYKVRIWLQKLHASSLESLAVSTNGNKKTSGRGVWFHQSHNYMTALLFLLCTVYMMQAARGCIGPQKCRADRLEEGGPGACSRLAHQALLPPAVCPRGLGQCCGPPGQATGGGQQQRGRAPGPAGLPPNALACTIKSWLHFWHSMCAPSHLCIK